MLTLHPTQPPEPALTSAHLAEACTALGRRYVELHGFASAALAESAIPRAVDLSRQAAEVAEALAAFRAVEAARAVETPSHD